MKLFRSDDALSIIGHPGRGDIQPVRVGNYLTRSTALETASLL